MKKKIVIKKYRAEFKALIPINGIISFLLKKFPHVLEGRWRFEWNDMGLGGPDFFLNGKTPDSGVVFIGEDVFPQLLDQSVYFDDGQFSKLDDEFSFGIHDSQEIYVVGADTILEDISKEFSKDECSYETLS